MANLIASMTAGQRLGTRLVAIRDLVLAGSSYFGGNILESSLATTAVSDDVGRARTMSRLRILGMAGLLALMLAAVEVSVANVATLE